MIAASVKTDLIEHTIDHRRQLRIGPVLRPFGIDRPGLGPVVSSAGGPDLARSPKGRRRTDRRGQDVGGHDERR